MELTALEEIGGRFEEKLNTNTKMKKELVLREQEQLNLFDVPAHSTNLPAYLKMCIDKYDEYSSQERSLLSETLLSWFMIEGKLGKALSEDRENAWRFRLGAMRATFQNMDKY